MNDKELQRCLWRKTTDELLEVLELRESLALFYSEINTGPPLPLVTRSERMCSLIKSELGRRGAFDLPEVVDKVNSQNLRFWGSITDEERIRFRELRDELGLGDSSE
jgi:hypothetical protein